MLFIFLNFFMAFKGKYLSFSTYTKYVASPSLIIIKYDKFFQAYRNSYDVGRKGEAGFNVKISILGAIS